MPLWGPYSKKYMGLSRIMKESRIPGARFDLVIYPTYANSAVPVPNVTVPSGYHPWECDAEGSFFRYRYELIWKDMLYADVDLFCVDEETWGIRVDYQNNTTKIQNCLLNFFSAIEYPQNLVYEPELPAKSEFWNALEYEDFSYSEKRAWEKLNFDGTKRGEVPAADFTEGNGLGETIYGRMFGSDGFGNKRGDKVSYVKSIAGDYEDAVMTIRYMTYEEKDEDEVVFDSNYGTICFPASAAPATVTVDLGRIKEGPFTLCMEAAGGGGNKIALDCFCITEREYAGSRLFRRHKRKVIPEIHQQDGCTQYQYHYGEEPIYLHNLNRRVKSRKLYSGCIEDALITRLTNSDPTYDNLTRSFSGAFMEKCSDEGFYHVNVAEAIFLPGQSSRSEYAYISTDKHAVYTKKELEVVWRKRYASAMETRVNQEGETYRFSARLMKTALFSNVVYPIRRHGEDIVHYTPGKRWDSLYTWDSGFIGLGLLEYSKKRAEYVLDTYLSEEDNTDFAFVAHGSLVPSQFYLWYELLQKSDRKERQEYKKYYPMLQRYYRFMAGKSEGSTMARLGSGLLTVYDYFYNAGGMDDYPPQVALHKQHLEAAISPVCSNVHFIRIAKIMIQTAEAYGIQEDIPEYRADIEKVSRAFQSFAWDEESGYYGYVLHGEDGSPTGILRTENGENYNKGIDGVTPLITGICSEAQEKKMLTHVFSGEELWTDVGISTVDRSASYYYDNGYWNGSVWFPYQYLLWKSMLDIGEGARACQIAHTALEAWKQEVEFSYNTFEMIQIETERGGWFHQFGGLSAPVVIWYHAYYSCGNVTAGYDTWIEEVCFDKEKTSANITCRVTERRKNLLLVVMNSAYTYDVNVNGKPAVWEEHVKGAMEIFLPDEKNEVVIARNE